MSDHDHDFSRDRMPWLRSGFDLEGYVGAVAAWLAGVLLGLIWSPLFWIGFTCAVVILLATRTAERTPPPGEDLVVAPCDGMVVSVGGATPPDELRLDGSGWTRIRVSIGPMCSNAVTAPMDGAIDHIIRETGDPAAFAATKVDRPGLAVAYVALESPERALGLRLATGGLGPRLEIHSEPGDAVRLGRNIGTLRLGGWCDIFVQSAAELTIIPGQTLIGSETVVARYGNGADQEVAPEPVSETAPDPLPELIEEDSLEDEAVAAEPAPVADEAAIEETATESAKPDEDEDVTEMFARLRKEAQKIQNEGET